MLNYLDWDSGFFRKKTGRIDWDAEDENSIHVTFEKAKREAYQLIYVFSPESILLSPHILNQYNGTLVDRKVRFEQKVAGIAGLDLSLISEYNDTVVSTDLENLTYASGIYSRFKLDKNFDDNDFRKLYKTWIIKSVNREIADRVFVYNGLGKIEGMVTLAIKPDFGQIGLIAVDENAYGRGIGKMLIEVCKRELINNSVENLVVYTQQDNETAFKFYQKTGFQATNITNIYHFWLV
jgi:dTDP-4-amino-4,6-dideoxy-D-galactose acyltransferase